MNINVQIKDFMDMCGFFHQNVLLSNGMSPNAILKIKVKFMLGVREFDLYDLLELQELTINYPDLDVASREICLLDVNVFNSPLFLHVRHMENVAISNNECTLNKYMFIEKLENEELYHKHAAAFAVMQTDVDRFSFYFRNIHYARSEDQAFRRKLDEVNGKLVMYRYLENYFELNRLKKMFPYRIKHTVQKQDLAEIFADFYENKDYQSL